MSVSRVCIVFRVAAHALSGPSLQAPSCERVPTLDCSCRSDLVVVDRSHGRLTHRTGDRSRSSARTLRFLSSGLTRESTARRELGICTRGPRNRREPIASQNQGPEAASEDASFIFNFAVDFAIGVYTCVTLCCTHRVSLAGLSCPQSRPCCCQKVSGLS